MKEILDDFKSLEDTANQVHLQQTGPKIIEDDKMHMQMQDFRRPKPNEASSNRLMKKFNRSYSLQEIKKYGVQLMSFQGEKSQPKSTDHSILLTEFIM